MGSIRPIGSEGKIKFSSVAKEASSSETTAAKVNQIKLPKIDQKGKALGGRQVTLLEEASDLSGRIRTDWDALEPEELAERIIALEDKVSLLEGTSPAVENVKKAAQHLHFKFVFPLALEMEKSPFSFATAIGAAAKQVFKSQSLRGFEGLNQIQKQEVMRYASKGNS